MKDSEKVIIGAAVRLVQKIRRRELRAGSYHKAQLRRMRAGNKNMRNGPNGGAANHHSHMWGFHTDRANIAREVIDMLRVEIK